MSYQTEEEQLAVIGQLWKKYGNKILTVVVLIAIAFYGYHAWTNYEKEKAAQASALYQQLSQLNSSTHTGTPLTKDQSDSFQHIVSLLKKDYPKSIYAQYAELLMAKQAVDANKPDDAKAALRSVINTAGNTDLKVLATIRLASILTSENEAGAKQALAELQKITQPGAFSIAYENAMGDAYLALKQTDNARKAYQESLKTAKKEGTQRPLVQLKLNNLSQPEEAHK